MMHGTGQLLGWSHACQIRLDLRDRANYGTVIGGRAVVRSMTDRRRLTRPDRAGPSCPATATVSANASETQPAKLLAVFVVDTNETKLTIPFGN